MTHLSDALAWTEIEERAPRAGLQSLVTQSIKPIIEGAPMEALDDKGQIEGLGAASVMVMVLFMTLFGITLHILPEVWWGTTLQFILFPILFFGSAVFIGFIFRKRLSDSIVRTIERRTARRDALDYIADYFGMSYSSCPAGPNTAETWLLSKSWLPKNIKTAAAKERPSKVLPGVDVAKDAGVLFPMRVLASTEEKRKNYRDAAISRSDITDGFYGQRSGVTYNMFEWSEEVNDVRTYHLTIVMNAPTKLLGYTELRARKIGWLPHERAKTFKSVGVPSSRFHSEFKLRTDDQVEARELFDPIVIEKIIALGHGDAFRAVGYDDHVIFDFPGQDRFAFIDILTGRWSDESLRGGLTDIINALDLVDKIGAMLRLKA